MDDTSCLTRADFVEVNKPSVRHLYATAWDDARQLVRDFRNLPWPNGFRKSATYEISNVHNLPQTQTDRMESLR